MLGRTDSRRRLLVLLVAFVFAATALIGRLTVIQVVDRDELTAKARQQATIEQEVAARRGTIYDRTGTVILATSIDRDRLVAFPDQLKVEDRKKVAAHLVRILKLDEPAAAELTARMTAERGYAILARELDPAVADRIRQGRAAGILPQVRLEPEPIRVYPQPGGGPGTTLAAHLVGFANREGAGQYGIEASYDARLAGEPKRMISQRDVAGRTIPDTTEIVDPGVPGADVFLTIDAGLQVAVEQEVLATWIADQATSVSAIVLDPWTGEIYAQTSYPSYDANAYRSVAQTDPQRFRDPIVAEVYEPGSVFKMFTAAAALEQGLVTPETKVADAGSLSLDGGRTKIDNADRKSMGTMSFNDAMAWSRNVIAARTALGLGDTTRDAAVELHEMWTRLGFGRPTGIDEAGEVAGIVHDPTIRTWREIDLANGAFGQGVAVTPIQLATAYAAMVNGGTLVQPHLVTAVGAEDRVVSDRGRVLEPELSATLVDMMRNVVEAVPLYAAGTLLEGYDVGGKTGTAQIWDPTAAGGAGAWKHNVFNYTFVGYVARERGQPDLVVAVRISEARPTVARVGYLELPVMSFELFRRIAHDAITTPGLLDDRPVGPGALGPPRP